MVFESFLNKDNKKWILDLHMYDFLLFLLFSFYRKGIEAD